MLELEKDWPIADEVIGHICTFVIPEHSCDMLPATKWPQEPIKIIYAFQPNGGVRILKYCVPSRLLMEAEYA